MLKTAWTPAIAGMPTVEGTLTIVETPRAEGISVLLQNVAAQNVNIT
jgi:hypothetical protein